MNQIWRDFPGAVRAVVPLFDNEVRGVKGLRKLAEYAFAESGTPAAV
jgi:hypothetical protein